MCLHVWRHTCVSLGTFMYMCACVYRGLRFMSRIVLSCSSILFFWGKNSHSNLELGNTASLDRLLVSGTLCSTLEAGITDRLPHGSSIYVCSEPQPSCLHGKHFNCQAITLVSIGCISSQKCLFLLGPNVFREGSFGLPLWGITRAIRIAVASPFVS